MDDLKSHDDRQVSIAAELPTQAAWNGILGHLINTSGRLRFLPHRFVMFALLAHQSDPKERAAYVASAKTTLARWQTIARGLGGDHRLIDVEGALSRWLSQHMNSYGPLFHNVCNRFDLEASALLCALEDKSSQWSSIARLGHFVSDEMLACVEELVRSFETALTDIARQASDIAAQAIAAEKRTASSASMARGLTDQLDRVNARVQVIALNALIEAARVGTAGRTFSVVAQEIKQLSGEIGTLSDSIRAALSDHLDPLVSS